MMKEKIEANAKRMQKYRKFVVPIIIMIVVYRKFFAWWHVLIYHCLKVSIKIKMSGKPYKYDRARFADPGYKVPDYLWTFREMTLKSTTVSKMVLLKTDLAQMSSFAYSSLSSLSALVSSRSLASRTASQIVFSLPLMLMANSVD